MTPSTALGRETSSPLREEGEERATGASRLSEGGMRSSRRLGAVWLSRTAVLRDEMGGGGVGAGGAGLRSPRGGGAGQEGVG